MFSPSHPLATSTVLALASALALVTACSVDTSSSSSTPRSDVDTTIPGPRGDAVPITIGDGARPGVALDAAGTAYIAWYGPETNVKSLQFCRLPRGAQACDSRHAIEALGTTLTRPFVTVSGSKVAVVSHRYGLTGDRFDAVYIYTSTDGGMTFDAGRPIGSTPYNDATVGPGDTISFATDAYSFGEVFENASTTASAPPPQRAILSTDHPYSGSVGLADPSTPVVVFADGSGNAQVRRYGGNGELNDATSWTDAQDIGHGEYMHLAGGPSGLFLGARSEANTFEVRRFDGSTFGPSAAIPEGTGELPQAHFIQDPAGRLHAVWPRIAADGIRIYYATSNDGASWESRLMLTSPDTVAAMQVAMAKDQIGVAAWEGPSASIRVLPLR